jgi:hypothetical protein
MWIHKYEPQSTHKSVDWKHMTSYVAKFRSQPTAGNYMFIVFWDLQGPALEQYKEGGVMINSEIMHDKLKLVIQSRR